MWPPLEGADWAYPCAAARRTPVRPVVIIALRDGPPSRWSQDDQDQPAVGLRFRSDDHGGLGIADDLFPERVVPPALPRHEDEVRIDPLGRL
jgi:hypothetical protein